MLKIDAHQHFWKYEAAAYPWISDNMQVLRHDFLPAALQNDMAAARISGVVSVQARQSVEDTRWLLGLAAANDFIKGVVGWAPLTDSGVGRTLEQFAQNPKLRGVRHPLQDEADEKYLLREDFNRGIRELKHFGLVYDILIFERQLPQTIEFVDKHPDQVFVVDHLAKPRVRYKTFSPWRENMHELAKRPNVYCKLSGLVTEADWVNWSQEQLEPYMDFALSAFGAKRVMFGSDWPVCLLALSYDRWVEIVAQLIGKMSADEQERIWSGTAIAAYGLE